MKLHYMSGYKKSDVTRWEIEEWDAGYILTGRCGAEVACETDPCGDHDAIWNEYLKQSGEK